MRFVTLDVFTDQPFGGNPLAVVLDADGLEPATMQQIAAEFGYSETTFVLPPERGGDARVRIFTPTAELPFAGHPNVGTALVLAEGADRTFLFEEGAGTVEVDVVAGRAEVAAPQPMQLLGSAEPELVARACGLSLHHLVRTPVVVSCGVPFALVEVASLQVLASAKPAFAYREHGAVGVLLHVGSNPVRARMFAPGVGVPEDPATGAAALALGAWLARVGAPGEWTIHQGAEVGRPSVLHVRAGSDGRAWVAGSAVPIMRGELVV